MVNNILILILNLIFYVSTRIFLNYKTFYGIEFQKKPSLLVLIIERRK